MDQSIPARKRKAPHERSGEILAAAAGLALSEGLQCLTLRRVADALGVAPGLINHYFPVANGLVAAAFAHIVGGEREAIFASLAADASPVAQMRTLLDALLSETADAIALIWLDAWQASRTRPALRQEVVRQMLGWQSALGALIERGIQSGDFHAADPSQAAVRILALIDGLSVQAAIRTAIRYDTVRDMVLANAERELGLAPGAFGSDPAGDA
jgi:AcrR family transcriptional regulator